MKRLVVCCDGTWNKPDNENVTNVEKIARTVQSDPTKTGSAYQLVYYISGVGTSSYEADRLLGGAFGFGLFHNVIACYRFLAQNYESGDEIFIIGFSRGAYTALARWPAWSRRSGCSTKVSLVEERLPEAVHLYQRTPMPSRERSESMRGVQTRPLPRTEVITLPRASSTPWALSGCPGSRETPAKFHDVQLSVHVLCARQGHWLIDEQTQTEVRARRSGKHSS